MLDADLKDQLASYLDRISQDVELSLSLDESETAAEIASLAEELRGLSPRIRVVRDDAADVRKPSFSIGRPGEPGRIRFVGVPLGHEFTSLVLALLHSGGHPPKAPAEIQDQIRALSGSLRFETFYSLSCHNCPDVVQALNLLATLNPQIEHVAIDGALVQSELEARQILGVPTVFLNGERFGQGRMELEEILSKLDSQHEQRKAERLSQKGTFDVLIVGGGPAGAAAAVYAARKGLTTGIVAERFGGQVLDTLAIENFISIPETQGPQFAAALEAHVKSYPVDLMTNERAKRLIPGDLVGVELENGATLRARSVVLATGAKWRDMNVPGEAEYRTKGVTYCPHCDGPLFKGQRVAVIGGGNSGVEAAIDLAGVVAHVTLLEFQPELRADAILQRKLRSLPNVEVIEMARTTEVVGDGKRVTGLKYEDRNTGAIRELELRGIFVQIGLLPSTGWLKDSVQLSPMGEIVVDAKGQTSVPGVFAAGDATTVPYKQIIIATGDGAKAALGAFEHLIRVSAPAA